MQAVTKTDNNKREKFTPGYNPIRQIIGLIFLLLVICSTVLGSYMVLGWMRDNHRLPLSWLRLTGCRYYTTNDDIYQAILSLGMLGNFMTQNIKMIQQKIECIPWIKQVYVRKQWPNELNIHIVEYTTISQWNDQYLLDDSGKIFSAPMERISSQHIPMLYGPEGSEKDVLNGYLNMNTILRTANFQLKTVIMSPRHSWKLILQDDTRLELGRKDIDKRLQNFIKIYSILLQQARKESKHISYIDLRYDSGLAVGWDAAYIKPKNNNQQQIQF